MYHNVHHIANANRNKKHIQDNQIPINPFVGPPIGPGLGPRCGHLTDFAYWLLLAECYSRQGDAGTKTAHFGSKICFCGNFKIVLKRISARNMKNILKPYKNGIRRSKTMIFDRDVFEKRYV